LRDNYRDYLEMRPPSPQEESKTEAEPANVFVYLEEADFQKPIWTSYARNPTDAGNLINYLPKPMASVFLGKRSLPSFDANAQIGFSLQTCDPKELPPFDETKRLKCPGSTNIKQVIDFADGKLNFEKYLPQAPKPFDPSHYIDITLAVYKDNEVERFISLPKYQTLAVVYNLLYPWTGAKKDMRDPLT
jgi:hypothetical protein